VAEATIGASHHRNLWRQRKSDFHFLVLFSSRSRTPPFFKPQLPKGEAFSQGFSRPMGTEWAAFLQT